MKRRQLWMLLWNFFPLAHCVSIALLVVYLDASPLRRFAAALACLYLLPPLLARLAGVVVRMPEGRIAVDSTAFLAWWATAQFQMIFNRLPILDELLRLVPGLYSNWLRLWGSRIGRLTFWAPGVRVLDRGYLQLGDDVVFGAGVRLNGHVLLKDQSGFGQLALAPIVIGSGAMIGGYALLTAGTEIAAGEVTRAHLLSPPFTKWRDGKRVREGGVSDEM
jgi:acetyltransferase-like isoleucine patch superfamily enzyme